MYSEVPHTTGSQNWLPEYTWGHSIPAFFRNTACAPHSGCLPQLFSPLSPHLPKEESPVLEKTLTERFADQSFCDCSSSFAICSLISSMAGSERIPYFSICTFSASSINRDVLTPRVSDKRTTFFFKMPDMEIFNFSRRFWIFILGGCLLIPDSTHSI